MKLSQSQIERLVRKVFDEWKKNNISTFKEDEKKVFTKAVEYLLADYQREASLDVEVNRMLDDLEKSNPGGFQRHKMFLMVKQKLAKEKGIIL